MTVQELKKQLHCMPADAIAQAAGSKKYSVIDRAITGAMLYAIDKTTDADASAINSPADVLQFVREHKDYNPCRFGGED